VRGHVGRWRRSGQELDFLTQELLRETNTLGAKAQDEQITYQRGGDEGLDREDQGTAQNLEVARVGQQGLFFLVAGPAGVGKSTVLRRVVAEEQGW